MFEWLNLDFFSNDTWMAWGIGLLIGFPLLSILFGEMLYRIEGGSDSRKSLLGNAQYLILPSLVVYLLLTQVLDLNSNNTFVQISSTILWISIIYLSLSVFNIYWDSQQTEDQWQSRVPSLILNIGRLFFILFSFAIVMAQIWGIDLGKMLAALGVGSIVLGLALQDTLGGLFAGITLISARKFQVGDWLKTGDVVGKVTTVNWHSVTLKTFENDLLVIPNSLLAGETFYNYSRPERVHMERVVIDFCEEHPPNMVRKAMLEAAHHADYVLDDPAPQVKLIALENDAGSYEAQIWFSDYGDIVKARDAYLSSAWYAAKRNGIIFPYEDHQMYYFKGSDMMLGKIDTIKDDGIEAKLQQLETFELNPQELALLAENSSVQRYGEAETILKAGEETEYIYAVLTGKVQSFVRDINNKKHTIGVTRPGSLFGVLAGLRHIESLTTVVAHHDLQIARISVTTIEKLIKSNPEFGQSLEMEIENSLKTINGIRYHGQRNKMSEGSAVIDQFGSQVVNLKDVLKRNNRK
jgi:small-conductance mechanosensitive channel